MCCSCLSHVRWMIEAVRHGYDRTELETRRISPVHQDRMLRALDGFFAWCDEHGVRITGCDTPPAVLEDALARYVQTCFDEERPFWLTNCSMRTLKVAFISAAAH